MHRKSGPSLWTRISEVTKTIVEVAGLATGALLAALLAVAIIALALMNALARLPYAKDLEFVRRRRPTSFFVETLDDSSLDQRIGPAITGLLRNRISVRGDRLGLDYVTGQRIVRETLKSFKDLSASFQNLPGRAGTAIAIVDFLAKSLPRRRFVLRGELQPAGPAGPGLSLALQDSSGEDSLTVLWAAPLEIGRPGIPAYQRLAVPAAAWADHRLTSALATEAPSELLSCDADSWAFFRAGLECHRLGEDPQARSLYEQALGRDGTNIGALANLGLLERREHNFARAQELLERAGTMIKERAAAGTQNATSRTENTAARTQNATPRTQDTTSTRKNPDWYRICYQLAALHLNRASLLDGKARLEDDLRMARKEAGTLASVSVRTILELEDTLPTSRPYRPRAASRYDDLHELMTFLQTTIAPSSLTLLAGSLLYGGEQATAGTHSPAQPLSYKDVLGLLEGTGAAGGVTVLPDSDALVEFVEAQTQLDPSVYYNLACYQIARMRKQLAKEWLVRAFLHTSITERLTLLRVVEKDPTLNPLTEKPELLAQLREYLPTRPYPHAPSA